MKRKSTEQIPDSSSLKRQKKITHNDKENGMCQFEAYRLSDLPGADILYFQSFVAPNVANGWYTELMKLDTWYHPKLKVYGKDVSQSRSIAAYASDPDTVVRYSGHTVELHRTYPTVLHEIQDMIQELLGVVFNHVMLNRYEDGSEYIGRHRDTKENKVIASLSLGALRTFILTPNGKTVKASSKKIPLANGSLIVMQGDTQKNWKHEIPREMHVNEGRISLTFRQLQS